MQTSTKAVTLPAFRAADRPALLIGLGNSGASYRRTYHNAGAAFLEYLADELHASPRKTPARAPFTYAKTGTRILVWPRTFMNESGRAVASALAYFKKTPQDVLVCHDDTDLALGTYAYATGRGHAGHRGVASLIETLGTNAFARLRIGMRPSASPALPRRLKAGSFVLQSMTNNEESALRNVFKKAAKEFRLII